MSLDPQKVAECRAWLRRAWADLDSSAILLAAPCPRPDTALFHCQQAAEKAWKGLLFWHDVPLRKTHNLSELGETCVGIAPSLAPLAKRTEDLTQFARVFRCPGEPEEPSRQEAAEAMALARRIEEVSP